MSLSFSSLSFLRFGLRREIPVVARHAVFIRSAMDLNRLVEIAVRRRGRRLPFQRRGPHGLSEVTFLPFFMLRKKLMMNGICASPRHHAAHEMCRFMPKTHCGTPTRP